MRAVEKRDRISLRGMPADVGTRLSRHVQRLLWACFLFFLFCGFTLDGDERVSPTRYYRLSNLMTYACVLALVWASVTRYERLIQICTRINPVYRWLGFILVVILVGLLTGFGFAADFWHNLGWEFLPMFSIVIILLAPVLMMERERVMKILAVQSMLGGLLAFYVVYKYPVLEGRGDLVGPHYYAFGLTIFSTFPLAYLRHYSRWYQLAALVGYAGYAYLTLAYQSRGGSFLAFILFPAIFLITQFREGIAAFLSLRILAGILIFLAISAYWLRQPEEQRQLKAGVEGTINRLFDADVSTDRSSGVRESLLMELQNSRGAESAEFISRASPLTWAIGRGWGGGWDSLVMAHGQQWSMVHFGPLNLVLKGGVGLMILFHVFIFSALWRSWHFIGRDPLASPAFCCLACFYAGFLKHGPIGNAYSSYITWIILGVALSCRDVRLPTSRPAARGPVQVAQMNGGFKSSRQGAR